MQAKSTCIVWIDYDAIVFGKTIFFSKISWVIQQQLPVSMNESFHVSSWVSIRNTI